MIGSEIVTIPFVWSLTEEGKNWELVRWESFGVNRRIGSWYERR
ncbi:hypothetical protein DsansV1_C18g0155681 [Dioscorea sansibarensis]